MYQPSTTQAPSDVPGLLAYVRAEFKRVADEFSAAKASLNLQVLYAAPAKFFPGMLVYADGVRWNPDGVSGEGPYCRNAANTTWVFIG